MRISLETLTKYPVIWLGMYAVGSVMIIATVAHVAGGTAAGSAAGFFALTGTFGYDFLTRRTAETRFAQRVRQLEDAQKKLSEDVSATHDELDMIKEDLGRAQHRTAAPTSRKPASAFMPRQKPANAPDISADDTPELVAPRKASAAPSGLALNLSPKAQKYKDILKNWAQPKSAPAFESEAPAVPAPASPLDYSDAVVTELLHRALEHDRIEIFAQPVVRLPSRKLAFVELFARIRAKSGVYLSGERYRAIAEKESVIEHIDLLLLRHALRTILHDAHSGADVGYFINISSRTLTNRAYVSELVEFLKTNRDLAGRFIFEMRYRDFARLSPVHTRVLKGLCALGCRLSLDNMVRDDNFDPTDLIGHNISFVKYSAAHLIDMCQNGGSPMDVARLKAAYDRCDITLIVEKFEEEHDVLELLDFEIDFGEGYLFGKPDLEMAYRSRRRA